MEQLLETLGWKKMAGVLVVISMLVLVFLIFSFIGIMSKKPQTVKYSTLPISITPNSQNGKPSDAPTLSPSTPANLPWSSYFNSFLSFQYPQIYNLTVGKINQEGDSLLLNSPLNNQNIEFQVYEGGTSLNQLSQIFSGFGYVEKNASVDGLAAFEFQGSLKSQNPQQEVAVIFEKNLRVYKIQLIYDSATYNDQIYQTFSKIVSTVQLP